MQRDQCSRRAQYEHSSGPKFAAGGCRPVQITGGVFDERRVGHGTVGVGRGSARRKRTKCAERPNRNRCDGRVHMRFREEQLKPPMCSFSGMVMAK
jgi:hypothetical protein